MRTREALRKSMPTLLSMAVIGGGIVGLVEYIQYGNSSVRSQSYAEANKEASERFEKIHATASPIGKFTMDYLSPPIIKVFREEQRDGSTSDYHITVNSDCLSGTPYDVRPEEILKGKYEGILSDGEVSGKLPSGASVEISGTDPDVLIVTPEAEHFKPLRLEGLVEGQYMEAADDQTSRILEARGCTLGSPPSEQ